MRCRPLRVLVEDCRVMIDVEARNAIIAMVMHLLSAFKMPARPRTPQARHFTSPTPRALQGCMLALPTPSESWVWQGWCM